MGKNRDMVNHGKVAKVAKTNAVRLLEKAGIKFAVRTYPVDEEHLEAQHVADSIGEDIHQVFKTIVLHGERAGYFVCVVPGNCEIDLKKAAKAAGDKKVDLIHVKELLPLTGYIRGGCSPVGMKKAFPTYFHSTVLDFVVVYVSAGQRGMQLEIAPQSLIDYCRATVTDLVKNDEDDAND